MIKSREAPNREAARKLTADHRADDAEQMKKAVLTTVMNHCRGHSHDDTTLLVVAVE